MVVDLVGRRSAALALRWSQGLYLSRVVLTYQGEPWIWGCACVVFQGLPNCLVAVSLSFLLWKMRGWFLFETHLGTDHL